MRARRVARGGSRGGAWSLLAIGLLFAAMFAAPSVSGAPASAGPSKLAKFDSHISHIIFLMQENHAFDNLFGEYCPAAGPYCSGAVDGLPSGICVPDNPAVPTGPCLAPYNFSAAYESLPHDIPHNWNTSHEAWNNGSMNGFVRADGNLSLGHYNGSTVPVYWDLAEEYGLADNYYSGALTSSLANHWYAQAAQPPVASFEALVGLGTTIQTDHKYLNEANRTPTFEAELLHSSVTWKYYDAPLQNYSAAITNLSANNSDTAYDYWNPLAARAQSYTSAADPHFVARTQFFADAANGTLPDVSWIIPDVTESDHPPENITAGQTWVASVVDALEASPEWNSSVLFISWDEYGGFYDHVDPPSIDAYGAGFRVPLLAVGPWVRQGVIDGQNLSVSSVLHLMEERFGLHCLGPRDCDATLPLDFFNFGRVHPRAPIFLPPFANASYPMPLESSGALPPYLGAFHPAPSIGVGLSLEEAEFLYPTIDWS